MTVRTMIPILAIVCVTMTTGWREKKRSDNPDYDIRRIPRELGLNADAVVRLKNLLFEIDDDNTAVLTVTRAVTVFNKNGRDHGELTLWYDKFQEIDDLEGTIYDENGIELKTLNDEDVKDWSSLSDYSLYEDSRVRVATLYENKYPYTVEFKYSIEYKGSLNWPVWFARESIDPVELSHFEVSFPLNMEIRYWCNRDTVRPNCTRQGDRKVYAWEERSLGKLSRDEVGDVEDITTIVRIAPTTFSLEDHSGSMTSWKDFGNWYRSLTQERNLLPEGVGKEIHSLIDSLKDQRDKVRALYRYMQSRTRYVSVRLGIGGWQPFDATYVHERGYGDCKALSNYMAKKQGLSLSPFSSEMGISGTR